MDGKRKNYWTMENNTPSGILLFQLERDITSLYKNYLNGIEDLQRDYQAMLNRLEAVLPDEYHSVLRAADCLDKEKLFHIRKRVLDSGNSAIRGIREQVNQFHIGFGNN